MATKNELAINNKWSQLTKKEKSRFKNKQSFSKRRQTQLAQQSSGSKSTSAPTAATTTTTRPSATTTTTRPSAATTNQNLLIQAGADDTDLRSGTITGSKTGTEYDLSDASDLGYMQAFDPKTYNKVFTNATEDLGTDETGGGTDETGGGTDETGGGTDETGGGTDETGGGTDEDLFDYEGLIASLTESIGGPLQTEIDRLAGQLSSANTTIGGYETTIGGLRTDINNQKADYDRQIGGLQGTLETYGGLMTGYQNQITGLRDDLRKAQEQANQLKIRDTRYIADNSAGGVRLKRSNKFNSGAFAMGTGQLNRNFKSPLSISNVNL